jgi:catechol 2,3-dioxygenase-like lactoylglutathione lyase family enzyme
MLRNAHAYAKLPARDPARARAFYVDVLGLTPTWEQDGHLWFDHTDGSSVLVFPSAGRPSGDHDQCGWVVDDVHPEVAELRARGVVFEEFPGRVFVDSVTADGVFEAAWFRDTEGNLLNVRSRRRREGA